METVSASIMWPGPDIDVVHVFVEPTPTDWMPDLIDDAISVYMVVDENDEDTGEIAGIQIIDFLAFDRWNDLPNLPILWQLPGWPALPLDELLRRVQPELRRRAEATAPVPAMTD